VLYQSNILKQNLVLLAIILVYHLVHACQWFTISGLGCSINDKYTYIFFIFHNVSTEFLHASTSKFYILSSYISSNHFMQKDRLTHIHE